MATWLTHLRIAANIKAKIQDANLPYLMMGSIAPDSGSPDETCRNYTPSKEVTHCRVQISENESDIDLAAFYNKYLVPEKIFLRSDKTRSFLWGYYFHLIADKVWLDEYFRPFKKQYEQQLEKPEEDFIDFIRDEMYTLDFEYLQNHGSELITEFRDLDTELGFFDGFDSDLIQKCKKKITEFYFGEPVILHREYKFLNNEIIQEYIDKVTSKCIGILYK